MSSYMFPLCTGREWEHAVKFRAVPPISIFHLLSHTWARGRGPPETTHSLIHSLFTLTLIRSLQSLILERLHQLTHFLSLSPGAALTLIDGISPLSQMSSVPPRPALTSGGSRVVEREPVNQDRASKGGRTSTIFSRVETTGDRMPSRT